VSSDLGSPIGKYAAAGVRAAVEVYLVWWEIKMDDDILPGAFVPTLRQMVSFRNRVVHLYWDVDDATVYRILREKLGDFDEYVGYILDFVQLGARKER
jgi:uncharacterized protein YutE (UPF0331/DUF86 family)